MGDQPVIPHRDPEARHNIKGAEHGPIDPGVIEEIGECRDADRRDDDNQAKRDQGPILQGARRRYVDGRGAYHSVIVLQS